MNKMILLLSVLFYTTDSSAQDDPYANLKKAGIDLPVPTKPIANYVKYVRTGNLVFVSGHGPNKANGEQVTGKIGEGLELKDGYEAARLTGIQLIATLQDATGGDLRKVKRVVKLLGLVNCVPSFTQQPAVINGCSDLMVEIFGEKGRHARSAIGVNSLPGNIPVEVEMVVELE
jgi:enamine deaminase RidA (YjgF/YER057c/UK114 family)